ncbi:hypothetical protein ABZN20_12565 [Methylococcus sp. ANG]|uniref:hypothetical protein n=1 Tax=Methylococcus sp. ANG TaxID=3231903 RepID=UPI00345A5CC4
MTRADRLAALEPRASLELLVKAAEMEQTAARFRTTALKTLARYRLADWEHGARLLGLDPEEVMRMIESAE